MKTQLPYEQMMPIATGLVSRFAPNCTRIELAGSLRRQKTVIGDVEIIAIPTPAFYEKLDELLDSGKIRHVQPKQRWGEKLRSFIFDTAKGHTVQVDIFIQPDPATFGVNMMIRTGSSDFSHRMVTPRKQGGWMPDMYRVHEARVWLGVDVVSTLEETDVFRLWGMDYVPATLRTAEYKPVLSRVPTQQIVQSTQEGLVDSPVPASKFSPERAALLDTLPVPTFGGREGAARAAQTAIEASEADRMRAQGGRAR